MTYMTKTARTIRIVRTLHGFGEILGLALQIAADAGRDDCGRRVLNELRRCRRLEHPGSD